MTISRKLVEFSWKQNVCSLGIRQIATASFPLQFKISSFLLAEPLKAKKRVDPAILRQREEKRKKRLEKQIRQLEKFSKQLKPIIENEIPNVLVYESEARKRKIEILEEVDWQRTKVLKEWSKYKLKESNSDQVVINRILCAQKQALDELRLESEELYQAAVKVDESLIPFKFTGPVETPPIEGFPFIDGDYVDVSKKWI